MKHLLPFYRNYVSAMSRVSALEMALSVVLENPRYVSGPSAGFNGQHHRKRIFADLFATCPFSVIVETGTFIGDTTGFMAESTSARIHTCEVSPVFLSVAKSRLPDHSRITFHRGDSRSFLRQLIGSELAARDPAAPAVFVYLDAHWEKDLPLEEELDIVSAHVPRFVVMVDDFAVPADAGYGYDNYGKKRTLDLATFGPCFARHNLVPFFPAATSAEETGRKRGSVILTRRGADSARLEKIASLRRVPST